jgi:hypothetical protein
MQAIDVLFFSSLLLAFFLILGYLRRRMRKQQSLNEIWREFAAFKGLEELQVRDGQEEELTYEDENFQDKPAANDYETILFFHGKNGNLPFALECFATQGTPMRIGKLNMSRGDRMKIFTRIKIGLNNLPKGLRVYGKTIWSGLGKAVGMQDITTGDDSFDRTFVVKGKDPAEVINYLTPSRRMVLLAYADKLQGMELREEGLLLLQPGQTESVDMLEQIYSQMGSLASSLNQS